MAAMWQGLLTVVRYSTCSTRRHGDVPPGCPAPGPAETSEDKMAPPEAISAFGSTGTLVHGFDRDTQGEKTDLYYKKVETFQPAAASIKTAAASTTQSP